MDEKLVPLLDSLLCRAGWELSDVEGIVAGSGPGRFTSVRVGMTFAAALAAALGVPAVGLTRFEAAAARLARSPGRRDGRHALVFPGFREESYLQVFVKEGRRTVPAGPPAWVPKGGLSAALSEAGSPELYGDAPRTGAADFLRAGLPLLTGGGSAPLRPLYLKPANFLKTPR